MLAAIKEDQIQDPSDAPINQYTPCGFSVRGGPPPIKDRCGLMMPGTVDHSSGRTWVTSPTRIKSTSGPGSNYAPNDLRPHGSLSASAGPSRGQCHWPSRQGIAGDQDDQHGAKSDTCYRPVSIEPDTVGGGPTECDQDAWLPLAQYDQRGYIGPHFGTKSMTCDWPDVFGPNMDEEKEEAHRPYRYRGASPNGWWPLMNGLQAHTDGPPDVAGPEGRASGVSLAPRTRGSEDGSNNNNDNNNNNDDDNNNNPPLGLQCPVEWNRPWNLPSVLWYSVFHCLPVI